MLDKPHAITPTDTRDRDSLEIPVHLPPTATPETLAGFNAACIRVAEKLARGALATSQEIVSP